MRRICKSCGRIFDGDPAALKCPECVRETKSNILRDRTCSTCGKSFLGGPRAWYCPECREERKRTQMRQYKARKRAGTVRAIGSTDICVICGKPYIVESGLQQYCPSCAPQQYREIDRAQSREWNAKHTTPEARREKRRAATAPNVCAICGKTFIPQPDRANATTCSTECSSILAAQNAARWEKEHRDARNEYHVRQRKLKESAMSPEEYKQYRADINRRARENYSRQKKKI